MRDKFNELHPEGLGKPLDWTHKDQLALVKQEARIRGIDKDKEKIKELIRELKKREEERRKMLTRPPLEVEEIVLKLGQIALGGIDPEDAVNDKELRDYTRIKDGLIIHLVRQEPVKDTLLRQQALKDAEHQPASEEILAGEAQQEDDSDSEPEDSDSKVEEDVQGDIREEVAANETMTQFNESIIIENEFRGKFPKSQLVRGLNLFGKCSRQQCEKQYIVKLGYGEFELGKRLDNQFNESMIFNEDAEVEGQERSQDDEEGAATADVASAEFMSNIPKSQASNSQASKRSGQSSAATPDNADAATADTYVPESTYRKELLDALHHHNQYAKRRRAQQTLKEQEQEEKSLSQNESMDKSRKSQIRNSLGN